MKKALITGVSGQDGSYLAELLLDKGYEVHGIVRRASVFNTQRIDHLHRGVSPDPNFYLHYGDLCDSSNLFTIVGDVRPDEIYNLAAQSHVRVSFDMPEYTAEVDAVGTLRLLDAIRRCDIPDCRFYQASTSEMFGKVHEIPQRETTPFHPRSPYGVAKVYSYWIVNNFRESYNMHASNGILFNHESPRRGENFVTRKVTIGLARIKHGLQKQLVMGNLDAKRDWGFAKEYVEAMWLMLQQDTPDDYVIATGETYSVRHFIEEAFRYAGLDWQEFVTTDERYHRPAEVDVLIGDASKAYKQLGWKPKTSFAELVRLMVDADMELVRREVAMQNL